MVEDIEYNLKPIHKAILDVYREFYALCLKHGIRFFAAYGTGIGATRHHGFIPWDDDLDVFIPRDDYERLWQVRREFPVHLKFVRPEYDENYNLPFGKILDTRQDVLKRVQEESGLNCGLGIFIDLFVMDGLPSSRLGMLWFLLCRSISRRLCDDISKFPAPCRVVLRAMRGMLGVGNDVHENLLRRIKWFSKRKYICSDRVGPVYDGSLKTWGSWWRRSLFASAQDAVFEDVVIPVAIGNDEILRSLYGDYMQLPPLSQRKPSHQVVG